MEAGHSVAILEAMGRIGGRAHTDTTTFGLPFDRGCSWIHSSDVNPYTPYAREYGFTLESHDGTGGGDVRWAQVADRLLMVSL